VTGKVGVGFDSAWNVTPNAAKPPTGLALELSGSVRNPITGTGARGAVRVDSGGVSLETQWSSGRGRTTIRTGPDGIETPEPGFGGSVPGFTSPLGLRAAIEGTMELSPTPPGPDPATLDSDLDGNTDGSLQESPELGGRQGQNFSGTAPNPLDSDKDGVVDRSDRTMGRDSDEDGVPDDADQKPGEVDLDVDHDGVADQFDKDIDPSATDTAPDSDGDGFSDGSFAESPETGGRGSESSYGSDQSAPASDDADADTGDAGESAGGF
jgi:hypothetical protein